MFRWLVNQKFISKRDWGSVELIKINLIKKPHELCAANVNVLCECSGWWWCADYYDGGDN